MEEKLEIGDKLIVELTSIKDKKYCNIELHKQDRKISLAFGIPLENEEDFITNIKAINLWKKN